MSIYHIGEKVENPKEWNKKNTVKAKFENGKLITWGGCIGTRACEECGHLLSGTCMCIPSYTCPVCSHEHKYEPPKYEVGDFEYAIIRTPYFSPLMQTEGLGI